MIRTAIIAVNDGGPQDERVLAAVAEIRKMLQEGPFKEVDYQVVPDEQAVIRSRLRILSENDLVDLVLTSGGTGLAMKERTPEATKQVIEREVPGLADFIRIAGLRQSAKAALFRGVCGVRRQTLIINLPGGPQGVQDSLKAIIDVLPHAVDTIIGEDRSKQSVQPLL